MDRDELIERVRALDAMVRPVTAEEADLIKFVQDKLRAGKKVSSGEIEEIAEMYLKYFDDDEDTPGDDEDGVDEDDFV